MSVYLCDHPEKLHDDLPIFRLADLDRFGMAANNYMDLVVKCPGKAPDGPQTPVGMVSKTYNLIQHRDVLREAVNFVERAGGEKVDVVEVCMTPNAERFFLKIDFGPKFHTSPDGSDIGLQLLCRNAVDGTCAVRASLGWFRFVCANGLAVGVTIKKVRLVHREGSDLRSIFGVLNEQMEVVDDEKKDLQKWTAQKINPGELCQWVDSFLAEKWGPLAASRVWHICSSGRDAAFAPPFRREPASVRSVKLLDPVPGSEAGADNIYAVLQALSWVASHRANIAEADCMIREIPRIVQPLLAN